MDIPRSSSIPAIRACETDVRDHSCFNFNFFHSAWRNLRSVDWLDQSRQKSRSRPTQAEASYRFFWWFGVFLYLRAPKRNLVNRDLFLLELLLHQCRGQHHRVVLSRPDFCVSQRAIVFSRGPINDLLVHGAHDAELWLFHPYLMEVKTSWCSSMKLPSVICFVWQIALWASLAMQRSWYPEVNLSACPTRLIYTTSARYHKVYPLSHKSALLC